jgi:hypothetical protein
MRVVVSECGLEVLTRRGKLGLEPLSLKGMFLDNIIEMSATLLEPLLELCPLLRILVCALAHESLRLDEFVSERRRVVGVERNLLVVVAHGVVHCQFQMTILAHIVERAQGGHDAILRRWMRNPAQFDDTRLSTRCDEFDLKRLRLASHHTR